MTRPIECFLIVSVVAVGVLAFAGCGDDHGGGTADTAIECDGSIDGFIVNPVQADVGVCYMGGYKIFPETDLFSTAVICLQCVDESCYVEGHFWDQICDVDNLTGRLTMKQGETKCEDRAAPQVGTTSYVFPLDGYVKVTEVRTHGGGGANDLGLR